jgi:peptide/nickel transport system permease protein
MDENCYPVAPESGFVATLDQVEDDFYAPLVVDDTQEEEIIHGNQLRRMWHSYCKRKVAVAGLIIVVFYVLVAIFATGLAPFDPLKQDLAHMLESPGTVEGSGHLLGTDEVGRDLLSRLIYGTRISMRVGFVTILIGFGIGAPLGVTAGFFGGKVDMLIMRTMDVLLSFPQMLLAMLFTSILGTSLDNAILAVGMCNIPRFARTARSEALSVRGNEFVEAARALGASNLRIIFSHKFINVLSPLINLGTLIFGNAIITTAGLGFMGIGAQPPTPEWGAMLSNGRQYLLIAPHVCTITGFCIMFLVLGLNLMGDGLRDVLDPRLKD